VKNIFRYRKTQYRGLRNWILCLLWRICIRLTENLWRLDSARPCDFPTGRLCVFQWRMVYCCFVEELCGVAIRIYHCIYLHDSIILNICPLNRKLGLHYLVW
jgi:hypothetical protein